jgi:hypothetical protein
VYAGAVHFFLRKKKKKKVLPFSVLRSFSFITSRGFGWRIHCGVEVTESSTNKQHTLSYPNRIQMKDCSFMPVATLLVLAW